MSYRTLSLFLFITTLVGGYQWYSLQSTVNEQKSIIASLTQKSTEETKRILVDDSHSHTIASASLHPHTTPLIIPQSTVSLFPKQLLVHQRPEAFSPLFVDEKIHAIETTVPITGEERVQLQNVLKDTPLLQIEDSRTTPRLLEILGEMRTRQLQEAFLQKEKREEEEEIDKELVTFARRLSLTADQSEVVREVIREVRAHTRDIIRTYTGIMEDINARHQSPESERGTLRDRYLEMKSLREQLNSTQKELYEEKLKGIVTEEQLAQLIAEE